MHIVVAPQAFKGSLSVIQAAEAMQQGVLKALPDANIALVPVADGGDGTLEAILRSNTGSIFHTTVTGPRGLPCLVPWGLIEDSHCVLIELAQVCGLMMLSEEERNPFFMLRLLGLVD